MRAEGFQLLNNVHAFNNAAENDVLVVQPAGLNSGDEELASVGVGASIGHGHDARSSVLQLEVLVSKLAAIDGLATSAVVVGEVATLAHEVGNDAVEDAALVTKALLSSAQSTEVLSGLGHHITAERITRVTRVHNSRVARSPGLPPRLPASAMT